MNTTRLHLWRACWPHLLLAALLALLASTGPLRAQAGQREPVQTIVTSDSLQMQGSPLRNYFYFEGNVVAEGTNLELRCDKLTVVAQRVAEDEQSFGDLGPIESILAEGNVSIFQAGRSAFAGLAEVDPREGTLTLSENPVLVDGEVEVTGYQFILFQDQRKFLSIPDPNAPRDRPSRSVVRLGQLPDLGFDQPEATIGIGADDGASAPAAPEDTTEPGTAPAAEDTAAPREAGEPPAEAAPAAP